MAVAGKRLQERFRVKKSVEEIFAPFLIAVADQPHKLAGGVKRERTRPTLQLQTRFFGGAGALIVVAGLTARHEILPRRAPTARTRHHVVKRQFGGRECASAKLAGISVSQQNVLARKGAALLRDMAIGEKPDHRRYLNRFRSGVHFGVIGLFGLSDAL